jgi:hypothetical protein
MSVLTAAIYDRLSADATLTAMLATYNGEPAIFTTDPAPGNAEMPLIVSAGEVAQPAWDTKTSRGRQPMRDIRCYAPVSGSAVAVEAIAERVRTLLHRYELVISGYHCVVADVTGPTQADEQDAYGRIVSVRFMVEEL